MDGFASVFKRDSIPNSTYECMVLSKSLSLLFLTYKIAVMILFLLLQ